VLQNRRRCQRSVRCAEDRIQYFSSLSARRARPVKIDRRSPTEADERAPLFREGSVNRSIARQPISLTSKGASPQQSFCSRRDIVTNNNTKTNDLNDIPAPDHFAKNNWSHRQSRVRGMKFQKTAARQWEVGHFFTVRSAFHARCPKFFLGI